MDEMPKVTALLQRWETSWNETDLDAMAALLAEDVHWVNVVGMHWRGKRAVVHAHRVYLTTMFRGVAHRIEAVENVCSLPGGGLVVVALSWMDGFRAPDGATRPPGHNRMTLVLVPDGEDYLIQHGTVVGVLPQAQPFDPVLKMAAA